MKVAICPSPGAPLVVEDVSLPPLGDFDVRVKTDASGVCHTDLNMMSGMTGLPMPMVIGHEGAGTVLEIGKGVTRCKVGDRVILSWAPACGTCWHCVRQESQHCDHFMDQFMGIYGVIRADGSKVSTMAALGTFSEMMQVSQNAVVPVKTDLPAEQLALIGCGITTGVGAVLWTAGVKPGATVAVFGCGGVGLSVIQGARIAGASRIFAVDLLANKREAAVKFGATHAIDPAQGDVVKQIQDATEGRGVDYGFEVTGIPEVVMQAFNATRKHGTTVAVGVGHHEAAVAVPTMILFMQEKRLLGSLYGSAQIYEHFPMLVEFAERGQLDLASMISKRITLDQVNDAFGYLKAGDVIRTVILPS